MCIRDRAGHGNVDTARIGPQQQDLRRTVVLHQLDGPVRQDPVSYTHLDVYKRQAAACGAQADLVEVPGALEVPTAIAMAERLAKYDGYVALGCVIRGETTHYDTVCNDSSRALSLLGLQGAAIGNGILTVENRAQAEVRAEAAGQNKGGGAAAAALHLSLIHI